MTFFSILYNSLRFRNSVKLLCVTLILILGSSSLSNTNCHSFYSNKGNQTQTRFDLHYERLLDQFDLNFTKMTDAKLERYSLALDLSEGIKKRNILKRFGLDFSDPNFQTPTFREFLKNYIQVLNELKIPEEKRVYPTLTMIKGHILGDSGYVIKFVTPGIDPWPQEDGYRIFQIGSLTDPLNPPIDPFNVPEPDMFRAHKAHRYPLLAFHDIGHFVSFTLNETYAQSINQAIGLASVKPLLPSYFDRMFIVLEYLSLGNPDQIPAMKSTFKSLGLESSDDVLPQDHFEKSFETLDETTLIQHTRWLGLNFSTFMRDYGGGSVVSREKGTTPTTDPRHALEILLGQDPSKQKLSSNMNAPYRNLLLGLFNAYTEVNKDPKAFDKIIFESLKISNWSELQSTKWSHAKGGRELVVLLIRKHLARLEGFLWNSSHIPIEEWVSILLSNNPIDQNSRVVQVFTDFMTSDSYLVRSLKKDR